jgi:hypothetical protein
VGSIEPLLPSLQQYGLVEVLVLGPLCHVFLAIAEWDVPLLTHLTAFTDEEFTANTAFSPFIDRFGDNLTFLSLDIPRPDLPHLLASCPSLQQLVMGIGELMQEESQTDLITTHNCLERVALDVRGCHGVTGWISLLEDHLRFFSKFDRPTSKIACIIGSESGFNQKIQFQMYPYGDKISAWRGLVDEFAPVIQFEGDSGDVIEIDAIQVLPPQVRRRLSKEWKWKGE